MAARKGSLKDTLAKVRSRDARIAVIGLGYVGLPLALAFAHEFVVLGYDSDKKKREMLSRGRSYIDDVPDSALKGVSGRAMKVLDEPGQLREADVIVICVPTPLDSRGNPDLSYVQQAADIVRDVVRKGCMVILESTSYPGTTEEFLGKAIRQAGLEPGKDVGLAFSPERVDPGNKKYNIRNTPKVVGGVDAMSTEMAAELYGSVVEAGIVRMKDCKTAEAVKIVENIFRGVNIALVNELALIFEKMGIDTWEVIRGASSKPFAFMAHYPGPGVGGHCIPLDPLYLSYKAKQYGFAPRFIELSHEVNEFMKHHTVNLAMDALNEAGVRPEEATVAVMGLAYKADISDTRESPAIEIIEELSKKVKKVLVHDPEAKEIRTPSGIWKASPLKKVLREADCLVFVTDHSAFRKMDVKTLRGDHVRAIVDSRSILPKDACRSLGLSYRAIGRGG